MSADGAGPHSGYYDRIREHADSARAARSAFDRPADPPAEERAMSALRTGLGPLVALYIEARQSRRDLEFSAEELDLFHRGVNDWLEVYAGCYGVDIESDATVRTAAELLIETHNVRDVAQLLTHVPDR